MTVIFAAFTFIKSHWRLFAMGLLLIAMAWIWNSRNNWREIAHRWQENAETWRLAYKAQQSAYEAAQAASAAKFEAQRIKTESTYRILAERADNASQDAQDMRAAADRFARRMRAQTRTAGGATGGTSPGAEGGTAESGDGASADASVVVPRADFDTLVDNTIRLKAVQKWGDELIAADLAVKAE